MITLKIFMRYSWDSLRYSCPDPCHRAAPNLKDQATIRLRTVRSNAKNQLFTTFMEAKVSFELWAASHCGCSRKFEPWAAQVNLFKTWIGSVNTKQDENFMKWDRGLSSNPHPTWRPIQGLAGCQPSGVLLLYHKSTPCSGLLWAKMIFSTSFAEFSVHWLRFRV